VLINSKGLEVALKSNVVRAVVNIEIWRVPRTLDVWWIIRYPMRKISWNGGGCKLRRRQIVEICQMLPRVVAHSVKLVRHLVKPSSSPQRRLRVSALVETSTESDDNMGASKSLGKVVLSELALVQLQWWRQDILTDGSKSDP
jgi:hypothetical protein